MQAFNSTYAIAYMPVVPNKYKFEKLIARGCTRILGTLMKHRKSSLSTDSTFAHPQVEASCQHPIRRPESSEAVIHGDQAQLRFQATFKGVSHIFVCKIARDACFTQAAWGDS